MHTNNFLNKKGLRKYLLKENWRRQTWGERGDGGVGASGEHRRRPGQARGGDGQDLGDIRRQVGQESCNLRHSLVLISGINTFGPQGVGDPQRSWHCLF